MAYTEVSAKNIESILQNFIDDNNINIQDVFKNNRDIFKLQFRYKKFNKSVNAGAAKTVLDYQKFIYKLAAYMKYKTTDIRKLTKKDKEILEIPFEVNEGSSDFLADLVKYFKEVLDMIPEEQRAMVFIILIV